MVTNSPTWHGVLCTLYVKPTRTDRMQAFGRVLTLLSLPSLSFGIPQVLPKVAGPQFPHHAPASASSLEKSPEGTLFPSPSVPYLLHKNWKTSSCLLTWEFWTPGDY